MTSTILGIAQILVSVVLVVAILLQQRGTGLGGAFGGSGGVYRSKRGVERVVFTSTIVLGVLFVLNALASVILQ